MSDKNKSIRLSSRKIRAGGKKFKPQRSLGPGQTEPCGPSAERCRRKFLRFFPDGFQDQKYIEWERGYKWKAHEQWEEDLNYAEFRSLMIAGQYVEIAERTVRIESRTNLLFSFEKMALRDAVRSIAGAFDLAAGLYDFLHGAGKDAERFSRWSSALGRLPIKKTRVLTWPLATVFGFIARPEIHMFLKPEVTRVAAAEYGYAFAYDATPSWSIYEGLLAFAATVQRDLRDLSPRDMIDIQSFLWVQGSDEYAE